MALEWREEEEQRLLYRRGHEEEEITVDSDGLPLLCENVPYVVEGHGIETAGYPFSLIRHGGDSEPGVGELRFSNSLGVATIFGKRFRITSPKITDRQFQEMLTDVSRAISNLPFDFNTPTSLPYNRETGSGPEVLYQRFAYLRHIVLSEKPCLEELFGAIEANPHRTSLKEEYYDDISRISNVGPRTVENILHRSENLVQVLDDTRAYSFPVAMSLPGVTEYKLVPYEVLCERVEVTVDNAENRFIKHFLRNCLQTTESMSRAVERSIQSGSLEVNNDLIDEITTVEHALERMAKSPFLAEVGDLTRMPSSSQVLQRTYGYRQFFVHHHRMERAPDFPIDGYSMKRIIESKNAATLYEYWCFFAVAAAVEKLLEPVTAAFLVSSDDFRPGMRQGISLSFPKDVELFFNLSFSAPTQDGSYSVRLRPDLVLRANGCLHLMDAKFKYDDKTVPVELGVEATGPGIEAFESEEDLNQVFKLGDLYKMHAYRDAIHGTEDVWIIYPGTHFRFYEKGKGRDDSVSELENLTGVGAIPLKPCGDRSYLEQVIAKMLGVDQ